MRPSAYTTKNGTEQNVVYRGADGHIHHLSAGQAWEHRNLTLEIDAPRPAAANGDPYGYTTKDGAVQHVVYLGGDGQVHELFHERRWHHKAIGEAARAPEGKRQPAAYVTGQTQHVVYQTVDDAICELFAGDGWSSNVISELAGAPKASGARGAGVPTGFVTGNTQHVVYQAADDSICELFAGDAWSFNIISELAGAPRAAGPPSACVTKPAVQHVLYTTEEKTVCELFAGDTWAFNIVSDMAGAPKAVHRPFGFTSGDGTVQHVVYVGVDRQVHELFAGDSWQHNVLTAQAGAPDARGDVVAYTTSGSTLHVIYSGRDGQIHELFAGQEWRHNVLTELAGVPEPAPVMID